MADRDYWSKVLAGEEDLDDSGPQNLDNWGSQNVDNWAPQGGSWARGGHHYSDDDDDNYEQDDYRQTEPEEEEVEEEEDEKPLDEFTGKTGAQYTKENKLGSGEYGEVWKYRCNATEDFVAVKWANKGITTLKEARTELERLRQLESEYIARFRDVLEHGGPGKEYPVLVMELCDMSLEDFVQSYHAIDERIAVTVLYQLLLAVQYIHGKQFAHADLHVGNVMIKRSEGRIKVIDFGVAEKINDFNRRGDLRSAGACVCYMATRMLYNVQIRPELTQHKEKDEEYFEDAFKTSPAAFPIPHLKAVLFGLVSFHWGNSWSITDALSSDVVRNGHMQDLVQVFNDQPAVN